MNIPLILAIAALIILGVSTALIGILRAVQGRRTARALQRSTYQRQQKIGTVRFNRPPRSKR